MKQLDFECGRVYPFVTLHNALVKWDKAQWSAHASYAGPGDRADAVVSSLLASSPWPLHSGLLQEEYTLIDDDTCRHGFQCMFAPSCLLLLRVLSNFGSLQSMRRRLGRGLAEEQGGPGNRSLCVTHHQSASQRRATTSRETGLSTCVQCVRQSNVVQRPVRKRPLTGSSRLVSASQVYVCSQPGPGEDPVWKW